MTPEEIAEVWQRYVVTRDPELQEILVIQYEPLARYLARRALAKAPPHQDAEDILSYAHHGLLNAIERFDPGKGFKFETYATRRIAGSIIDGQRRQDPLGRPLRKRVKALAAAQDGLWDSLGRQPTLAELAGATGETEAGVRHLRLSQQTLAGSIDVEVDGHATGATHVSGGLVVEGEAEVQQQVRELRDGLAEMLPRLGVRERLFVLLHYVQRRTFAEVSQTLGLTEARCSQLRQEVIEALRAR